MAAIHIECGHLEGDPEVVRIHTGAEVTRMSIVETRVTGEANVFRVQLWGQLGTRAAESLRKGDTVHDLAGEIVTTRWVDKDTGESRTTQNVVATQLIWGTSTAQASTTR